MQKLFKFTLFFILVLMVIYVFRTDISNFLYQKFILDDIEISTFKPNEYYRENDYEYVQITDDFIAKNKQHLLNIYYTIINSGADTFTFACDVNYDDCLSDVKVLSNDQTTLSNINSFVHPFNGFSSVETNYDTLGRVDVKINKAYTEEEIEEIEKKMQDVINTYVKNNTNEEEIIKIIHNYIINNTKYDKERSDKKIVKYKSNIAYGPLFDGYGLCGGYTDAMALFLDYYDIPNFKVISENHIWNAVYINNKWYHLDLTWDDPISDSGKDVLEYTFFLIDTDELLNVESEQHNFNKTVFPELVY